MSRIAGLLGALLLTAAAPGPGGGVAALGWMAGDWAEDAGGRWTEERWTAPRGGTMLGVSRSGRGETMREFEFLRIAADTDGTPVYWASPDGAAMVPFRLARATATEAAFENAGHDYPQRIAYARRGDALIATISDLAGGHAMRWTYRRR